jgi:16S rRNA (guanine527-N7)-methyltransferase
MRIMDIGAGAGFPGIPLKICAPEISLTLIESVQKKSAFLHHVVRTLKLRDVSILTERIERLDEMTFSPHRTFDVIVARALASTEQIVRWSRPWLRADGKLILSRGPDVASEQNLFNHHRSIDGIFVEKILPFTLPFSDYQRNLVVLGLR